MTDETDVTDDNIAALMTDERMLPLARILHYAKCEATAHKLAGTARFIEQALLSLLIYSNTTLGPPT